MRTRRLAALAAAFALSGCSDPAGPRDELRSAHRLWTETRPAAYTFTFERQCYCLLEMTRPTVVVVRGSEVESLRYADTGQPVDPRYAMWFPTVDALFVELAATLARRPAEFQATYDRRHGYPTRVKIDRDRRVIDEEVTYVIRDWRAL